MKSIVRMLCAMFLGVPIASYAYVNCYWLSDAQGGTGGWADTTRWKDGVKPGPNDVVRISGSTVNAVVRDSDWDFFSTLYEIVLAEGATVTLDLTQDVTFNGGFQGSKGRVVKLNSNRIVFSGSRESNSMQLRGGEFIVSNGCLRVDALVYPLSPHIVEVWKPGVLELSSTRYTYLGGLVGDGIVSNAPPVSGNPQQLVFIGEILEKKYPNTLIVKSPWRFTGDFVGAIPLTAGMWMSYETVNDIFGPGGQVFDTLTATNLVSSAPRLYNGFFTVSSIGNKGGTGPSSIGNYDALSYFNQKSNYETGIRYIGPGGTSSRNFDLYYGGAGRHAVGALSVFDAGPNGGLTLSGRFQNRIGAENTTPDGTVGRFVLRGSNTAECAISGYVWEVCASNGLAFVKQGTGTWNFTTTAMQNRGPTIVERGCLKFASIAERGKDCSLGTANLFSTNWYGVADAGHVPFAHLLGDGSTEVDDDTATMEYTGSSVAVCTTRPFAVKGAGRIRNSGTGSLRLVGALSFADGENTLALGGTGTDNLLSDVTNGVGSLKIVKEDAGTWQLSGDVKLGGGVEVNGGTLRISNRFSWYRFNMKEAWGFHNFYFGFRLFGLWDEDGNLLTKDLANYSLQSKMAALPKGGTTRAVTNSVTVSWAERDWYTGAINYKKTDGVIANEVNPTHVNLFRVKMGASTTGNQYPKASEPDTWLRYAIRLPEEANVAVCYDIKAEETAGGGNEGMEMKSFGMDGSPDGIHWKEASAVDYERAAWGSAGNWHSTRSTTRTKNDGFRFSTTRNSDCTIADLPMVSVAANAVLDVEPEANVAVHGIAYDTSRGGGTVKGVSFASSGTFSFNGEIDTSTATFMPMTFENVQNLENAANWSKTTPLKVNGVDKPQMRVKVTAAGLTLCPAGVVISFR